jgi:hypothetical protein
VVSVVAVLVDVEMADPPVGAEYQLMRTVDVRPAMATRLTKYA